MRLISYAPRLLIVFILFSFLGSSLAMPIVAHALSPEQKDLLDSYVHYFDLETCSDGVGGASEGGPLTGVHFPQVADKAVLAKAIDAYIKKGWSSSPLNEYGEKYVQNGEKYDVNPLIPVIISQVEYQFGTARTDLVGPGGPGQYNYWAVTHNSNDRTKFGAYPSIDEAMEEHFKLLAGVGANAPGITYIGPPQNMTSISQIMRTYAPSFENDTPRYIKTILEGIKKIASEGGVTVDTTGETTTASSSTGCQCTGTNGTGAESTNLNQTLRDLALQNGGKTSISVASIAGGAKGSANGDEQMPTRSSYKVYTAYAALRAIESGKISWGTKVSASGWSSNSVEETMKAMIIKSNNYAAAALRLNSTIGTPAKVTKMLQDDVGLSQKTVMGSGGTSNSNSRSTANDYVKFLTQLEKHKLPGVTKDALYEKLLSLMKLATTDGVSARSGIAAGVKGAVVADKPGWSSGPVDPASNDVGIVYLEGKAYTVAILTDKPNQWDGVAKIAEGVNTAMGGIAGTTGGCASAATGDLSTTIKAYAWPTYSGSRSDPKPEYQKALDAAAKDGQYIGGGVTDCGAFVTRVMIDSGFEPNYNYAGKVSDGAANTYAGQLPWLKANWQKVNPKSTKDLQPGDVGISHDHTFVYVGKVDGFNDVFASASLGGRVPMAGQSDALSGKYDFYRKK